MFLSAQLGQKCALTASFHLTAFHNGDMFLLAQAVNW